MRVTNVANSTARDFYLDWAAVKVYHVRSGGPCQYAAEMGDVAKAAGIEVFTIGYGVGSGDPCSADVGAWADNDAVDVLSYIATDADHFFNEPSTADLRRIFEIIAATIIPTPPPAVGGMVELRSAPADHSGLQPGAENPPHIPLAALSAMALLALAAGIWCARRRRA